jgi:hypothetical protein
MLGKRKMQWRSHRKVDAEIEKVCPEAKVLFDYGVYSFSDHAGPLFVLGKT